MNKRKHSLSSRLIKFVRASCIKNEWRKKVFYLKNDFPSEFFVNNTDGVELQLFGLHLKENSFQFALDSYDILRMLHFQAQAQIYIVHDQFVLKLNNVELNITTAEELFIVCEIFIEGTYNFQLSGSSVVLDIGMNVGMASLFFAGKDQVLKVYGFEPFLPTFEQAMINFELNKILATKIEYQPFGLGSKHEIIDTKYDYENKGQVGIYGTNLILSDLKDSKEIKIELRSVSDELEAIIAKHDTCNIILKVDCEGSEYAIFKDLSEKGLLKKVKMIFIEWHLKGPEELIKNLTDNNFAVFNNQSAGKKVGMIYAVR